MTRSNCLWCEGEKLVAGRLQSTGVIYFKPSETKFFVQARVCSDYGYIDLYADTKKLKKVSK